MSARGMNAGLGSTSRGRALACAAAFVTIFADAASANCVDYSDYIRRTGRTESPGTVAFDLVVTDAGYGYMASGTSIEIFQDDGQGDWSHVGSVAVGARDLSLGPTPDCILAITVNGSSVIPLDVTIPTSPVAGSSVFTATGITEVIERVAGETSAFLLATKEPHALHGFELAACGGAAANPWSVALPSRPYSLASSGDRVYVGMQQDLAVVDRTDGTVAGSAPSQDIRGIAPLAGSRIATAGLDSGFAIWDAADPTNLMQIHQEPLFSQAVAARDGRIVLGLDQFGLVIYDDPGDAPLRSNFGPVGGVKFGGTMDDSPRQVHFSGDGYIEVALQGGVLGTARYGSQLGAPAPVGELPGSYARVISSNNSHLYGLSMGGVDVVDATNPASMSTVASVPGFFGAIAGRFTHAQILLRSLVPTPGVIQLFGVSNPNSPVLVDDFPSPFGTSRLTTCPDGTLSAVYGPSTGHVIDLDTEQTARVVTDSQIASMAFPFDGGQTVVYGKQNGDLIRLSILTGVIVSLLNLDDEPVIQVLPVGPDAPDEFYVATGDLFTRPRIRRVALLPDGSGVSIEEVCFPEGDLIRDMGYQNAPVRARGSDPRLLYVATTNSVSVIDWSDPEYPFVAGEFTLPSFSPTGLAVRDDAVFVVDGSTTSPRILALPPHCPAASTGAPATDLAASAASTRFRNVWPNPFASEVRASFALERGSPVRLDVFDVAGRRVRALADGLRSAGEHAVHWDGRDASGRPVPAGVYFLRFETGDRSEMRRLVRVR